MNKIKYLFSICFVAVFVFCMSVGVKAEETEIDTSLFEYEENEDGTINITWCNENEENVIIPSEIDGKKVKNIKLNYDDRRSRSSCKIKNLTISEGIISIMQYSFGRCSNLETVSLPSTIQTIGNDVFGDCNNLKTINLPEGLTSIGEYAFQCCYNLENIVLPNSLTNLGMDAFADCHSLFKISIPGNVDVIKLKTFRSCINLQEIEIKDGVSKIEQVPFFGCTKLQKVIIPNSVISINDYTFIESGLSLLKEVTIYADPNSYARTYANKIGLKFSCLNTHDWDNGIITVEQTIKSEGQITYTCTACGTKKTETLPTAVSPKKGKTISAFNSQDVYKVTKSGTKNGTVEFAKTYNVAITDISIPDTVTISGITYKVTSVAKNAFKSNKNLEKITIGKNVAKINAGAFNGCKNLSVINIKSKKLSSVGKNAFKGIKAKAKIKVPSSRLSNYKKLFADKGQKSTVKITK